jgi:phosphate-selective porin OprO/OprP
MPYSKLAGFWKCAFIALLMLAIPNALFAQDDEDEDQIVKKDTGGTKIVPDGTEGILYAVDSNTGQTKNPQKNDFDGPVSTFRIGLGLIYDFTAYSQSDEFKQQMDSAKLNLSPNGRLRDFRVLGSGVFKTKRPLSWKFAYMWDGNVDQWLLRETGLTVGLPELHSNVFIGRTKEGYSMVKVMNGHSPWSYERIMAIDAIPILADGIKWFGYLPKSTFFWNLGYYNDIASEGQSFSTFSWQGVARLGFLPINHPKKDEVLHIAANLRIGDPYNGKMTLKSRPESNPTPQIINTGTFNADHSFIAGPELYYRNKQFMIGSEWVFQNYYTDKGDNHKFYGGNFVLSYFFSKTVRPYNTTGSIFGFVPVRKGIFNGGWGEFEGVLMWSMLNLNDGNIQGGSFWRLTPMLNWYMTKILRMEFIYGYGVLDRYGKQGGVQFFESRFQVTLM